MGAPCSCGGREAAWRINTSRAVTSAVPIRPSSGPPWLASCTGSGAPSAGQGCAPECLQNKWHASRLRRRSRNTFTQTRCLLGMGVLLGFQRCAFGKVVSPSSCWRSDCESVPCMSSRVAFGECRRGGVKSLFFGLRHQFHSAAVSKVNSRCFCPRLALPRSAPGFRLW